MDHSEDMPCVDEHDSHSSLVAISSLLRPTSEFHRQVGFQIVYVTFHKLCIVFRGHACQHTSTLQVRRDVHRSMQASLSTTALGDDLRALGYSTVLHTNHEGDTSVSCLQSLRHTFIVCTGAVGGMSSIG